MRPLTTGSPTTGTDDPRLRAVPGPVGQAADRHAADLGRMTAVLTDDPELAVGLVARALARCGAGTRDPGLATFSAHVATSWLGGPVTAGTSGSRSGATTTGLMLDHLRSLPDDQRTMLALCRFGAHTYRQAADVLGLEHPHAAALLTTALRALAAADPTTDDLAVTA